MSKAEEDLRQRFKDETNGYLDATTDDPSIDVCYSDAYVYWLEKKVIEHQRRLGEITGKVIDDKVYELDAYETTQGAWFEKGAEWVLNKLKQE